MRVADVCRRAGGSPLPAHPPPPWDGGGGGAGLLPRPAEGIDRDGLRISGAGELVGRLRATTDAAELPSCDFGIVATKSMHTSSAIAAAAHAFAGGAVASVQNGAGNEELIAEHVAEVIRGTTFPAGHVIEPGHVGWDTKGDTTLGPFEPSPAPMSAVEALSDACTPAG